VKKKIFSIWSVLLILIVSIAVLVPGCDGACTGDIEVRATLCDALWEGDVVYKLTGPGALAPTIIDGTSVNATHSGEDCGNWTCEYVSGGPDDAYWVDITTDPTQEVTDGGTTTFTLNFELDQDAMIDWVEWTVDGIPVPIQEEWVEVWPCDVIDAHFVQRVYGCEERIVAVNETSELWITYKGYSGDPPGIGTPSCGGALPSFVHVVNDWCAVNKTAPAEKVSQNATFFGTYVDPGEMFELICFPEPAELDVETIWKLEKEIEYLKSIRWLGISFMPEEHPCVVYDLIVPPGPPGWYVYSLVAKAKVELMDDVDVDEGNNNAICLAPLVIWVNVA